MSRYVPQVAGNAPGERPSMIMLNPSRVDALHELLHTLGFRLEPWQREALDRWFAHEAARPQASNTCCGCGRPSPGGALCGECGRKSPPPMLDARTCFRGHVHDQAAMAEGSHGIPCRPGCQAPEHGHKPLPSGRPMRYEQAVPHKRDYVVTQFTAAPDCQCAHGMPDGWGHTCQRDYGVKPFHPHAFVPHERPEFGSAFGGGCAQRVDYGGDVMCGWPRHAPMHDVPDPCSGGRCPDPAMHAEGGHDV